MTGLASDAAGGVAAARGEPRRILLLTQHFAPEIGAAQTRLAALARELISVGHEVHVVTAMPNYPSGRIAEGYRGRVFLTEDVDGVAVARVWVYASMGTGVGRLVNYLTFMVMSVVGLLRTPRPDMIIVESPPLFVAVPGLWYARLRRVPSVLNVADLWPDVAVALGALREGRKMRALLRLERWAYRRATVVSTVTTGLVERIVGKGVPRDKVVLLPNGVDTTTFNPSRGGDDERARLGLPHGALLLYPGTMGLAHGLDSLIYAMADLDREPGSPTLLMLGGGSERPRLEDLTAELGLSNVVFRDPIPVDDLAALMPTATAGVVNVKHIAGPAVIGRSAKLFPLMAAGLPILSAGPGLAAEFVRDADAGVVVANEPSAIAGAIREMMADEERRVVWGANARRAVDPDWSWAHLVSNWLEAITQRFEQGDSE